jgi:hypothetical protein
MTESSSGELPPLCGPEEFARLVTEMVTDDAPRVFAVVQEYGDRIDARIAAWGLAHAGHVDVIGLNGAIHLGAAGPETVLHRYDRRADTTAHVIWPSASEPELAGE